MVSFVDGVCFLALLGCTAKQGQLVWSSRDRLRRLGDFVQPGHVPAAISLPREDFEIFYAKLKEQLEQNKSQPIVIYCSSESCEDSQMVKNALKQLGYSNVALFKGGWTEWDNAGLTEGTLMCPQSLSQS